MHVVQPRRISFDKVLTKVSELVECHFKNAGQIRLADYLLNTLHLLDMALDLEGGTGFVIAPAESYDYLQDEVNVDFSVVDKNATYPKGYMSQKLCDEHVSNLKHRQLLQDFAVHTEDDKWPKQHEAARLPKDGYHLYGTSGFCHLAAARLVGLPAAPYEWDGVGMRHTTALQLCWALRDHAAVVVVRSESAKVHLLCPSKGMVHVLLVER
jgi:hypothetical protein